MMESSNIDFDPSTAPITKNFQAKVSTSFKFFHALSTFSARPELLIPQVRSTDLDWSSLSPHLRKAHNLYDSDSIFDLLYSSIYHEGKCIPSSHVGELNGSLHENTIKSWTLPKNEFKNVELRRFVHHKPLKDLKCGWTSKIKEQWDFATHTVEILPVLDDSVRLPFPSFPTLKATYLLEEKVCKIELKEFSGLLENNSDDSLEFYANNVVPKILDWMSDDYNIGSAKLSRQLARPLSYVLNSKYWYFYDLIKSGAANYIKSVWEESTDPIKFIHEDIGIAAYIASFIYDDRSSKYRPINNTENIDILDLGCGNGLLCFFLSQLLSKFSKNSAVNGFDIRRRKIWSQILEKKDFGDHQDCITRQSSFNPIPVMPDTVVLDLQERSIVPHIMDDLVNQYRRPPEDRAKRSLWLIGNHSDELTPWIPVIARRMNATGFFIIPCCPFDFFKKYQRRRNLPGSSIYQNYIEYMCTVGDRFGYQPTLENLRIPSTKKICLVGIDCSHKFEPGLINSHVENLMKELKKGDDGVSLAKFVPRSSETIKVSKNIDRTTAKPIIDKIFKLLINDCEAWPLEKWYEGRQDLTFGKIMSALSQEEREILKGKGNGLRTLVKSNRHLFSIEKDTVKLRVPHSNDIENVSQSSRDKIKTRACYFYCYHPQGCPLSDELCAYKH